LACGTPGTPSSDRWTAYWPGWTFVFVYLDDFIIGSRSATEHSRHLRALFQRLQTAGLVINQEKCVFGVMEVEFLGHHVTAAGVSPIASRVATIQQHPEIATVKELQGFLSVINFYEGRDRRVDTVMRVATAEG
jgi:hypothetical protein